MRPPGLFCRSTTAIMSARSADTERPEMGAQDYPQSEVKTMSTTYNEQPAPAARGRGLVYGVVLILVLAGVFVWGSSATGPTPAMVRGRDIVGFVPLSGEAIPPPSARADVMAPFRAPIEKVETSIGK